MKIDRGGIKQILSLLVVLVLTQSTPEQTSRLLLLSVLGLTEETSRLLSLRLLVLSCVAKQSSALLLLLLILRALTQVPK